MRRMAVALLAMTLAAGACGGGGADPSATATPSNDPGPTIVPTNGSPAAVAQFRACHKSRDGVLVLILLLENRDRSLIGGFAGAIDFQVTAVEPATWTTTGEPVTVDPGTNAHVRQITVPADEPAPSEVTLEVVTTAAVDATNVLATNQVTVPVPASSCSRA